MRTGAPAPSRCASELLSVAGMTSMLLRNKVGAVVDVVTAGSPSVTAAPVRLAAWRAGLHMLAVIADLACDAQSLVLSGGFHRDGRSILLDGRLAHVNPSGSGGKVRRLPASESLSSKKMQRYWI